MSFLWKNLIMLCGGKTRAEDIKMRQLELDGFKKKITKLTVLLGR